MRSVDESGTSARILEKEENTRPRTKCEKMENSYFIVHDFMVEKLKLDGTELMVYALIYSFSNAGSNCYGSIEYISKRIGASRTTAYRALKNLVKKNYLIKQKPAKSGKVIYTVNDEILFKNETVGVSEQNSEICKIEPNNKGIKKKIITNYDSIYLKKAKPSITHFGPKKLVAMTLHQYTKLLMAFGVIPTLDYIKILEGRIDSAEPGAYKNHYKTIITWGRQDGLLDETARMILDS
nr:helix-turn-helix domain-containing protein [Oscillospiraceae bacterium]